MNNQLGSLTFNEWNKSSCINDLSLSLLYFPLTLDTTITHIHTHIYTHTYLIYNSFTHTKENILWPKVEILFSMNMKTMLYVITVSLFLPYVIPKSYNNVIRLERSFVCLLEYIDEWKRIFFRLKFNAYCTSLKHQKLFLYGKPWVFIVVYICLD